MFELFNHQIDAINYMKVFKDFKFGIIGGTPGTGKTITVLSFLQEEKINQNHMKSIIVVPRNIINQWEEDINKFPHIKYKIFRNGHQKISTFDVDILIITDQIWKHLLSREIDLSEVRHIFVDELEACRSLVVFRNIITFCYPENRNFWLISACSDQVNIHSNLSEMFKLIYSWAKITNTGLADFILEIMFDNSLEKAFNELNALITIPHNYIIPRDNVSEILHECILPPVLDVVNKYLTKGLKEMLQSYDIDGVVDYLQRQVENDQVSDLILLIKMKKRMLIEKLEKRYSETNDTSLLIRTAEIKKELNNIDEDYKNCMEEECIICSLRLQDPLLCEICQLMLCRGCADIWFKENDTCPKCRASNPCLIKLSDSVYTQPQLTSVPTREQIISEICSNEDNSVIIYTKYNTQLFKMLARFNPIHLRGHAKARIKSIKAYKKNEIRIMFLHTDEDNSGMRLENTTDIIFLENPDISYMEKQIVARALRLDRNRELPLRIHKFLSVRS